MTPHKSDQSPQSGTETLTVPGGRLAYDAQGRGASVVFIHSVIADRRMWAREFSHVAKDHRAVRFDLRGFGGSGATTEAFSNVSDLHALVTELHLAPVTLVGSSAGGGIAIDYALEHPGGVSALLLAAPGLSGGILPPFGPEEQSALEYDDEKSQEISQAWTRGERGRAVDLLQQLWCCELEGPGLKLFRSMVEENATEVFASPTQNQARATPAAPKLGSIHVPTTVVVGDRDNPSSPVFARRIAGAIPGARLSVVPGADHLVNLSQPAAFQSTLTSVLSGHRD